MAQAKVDLKVKDLQALVSDLQVLQEQLGGALKWQDAGKGHWGQLNANLSMGDFAANWRIHRTKMVKAIKSFKETVSGLDVKWDDGDTKLGSTLEQTP